jgi:hypothetical protein
MENKNKFNLQAALNGDKFKSEDGFEVIKWMYCEEHTDYPISCYLKDISGKITTSSYTKEGYYDMLNPDSGENLVMIPKTITKWVNVYGRYVGNNQHNLITGECLYNSYEVAQSLRSQEKHYHSTIQITIEI